MALLNDRKAFEDSVWNLATECERDMTADPYPKGAKARQDALFVKVMEKFEQLTRDLEAARADFKRESWAHAEYVVATQDKLKAQAHDLAEAKADLLELRETISPGRMADAEYYLNVAKKIRARELEIRPK